MTYHSRSAVSWLRCQEDFPRFYFRSRDRQYELAACGIQCEFKVAKASPQVWLDLKNYLHSAQQAGSLVIGGIAFNPYLQSSSEWKSFPALWFWKPKDFMLNLNADSKEPELSSLQDCAVLERHEVPDAKCFEHLFNKTKEQIALGAISKLVLARRVELKLSSEFDLLKTLTYSAPTNFETYRFCIETAPACGFWGVSPECLFKLEGRVLNTEALAGTAVSGQPLFSEKNISEQEIVKNYLSACLESLATEIDVSPLNKSICFDSLSHISTAIKARLKDEVEVLDILQKLHPSPAVCGSPLQTAYRFLSEFEPFSRGWYAGTLGVISPQHTEFLVAIRSVLNRANTANLYSGVGIVEQSKLAAEWQELESKLDFLLSMFG